MSTKKNFDSKNPNFVARVSIFALSVLALVGVKFPDDPGAIAEQLSNTLSGGGYFAVVSVLGISVIMPLINFVRSKPKLSFKAVAANLFGSPNFWVYLLTFALGFVVLFGVDIMPEQTSEDVVGAVYAKDWTNLLIICVTNIVDPVIRYFRDKRDQAED